MTLPTDFTLEPQPLAEQVAIITGGGRGLGRAFAQGLAAAGAKVAITARTASELNETVALIEETGGTILAFTADVTDRPRMAQVIEEIEGRLGAVEILVNNAAVLTPLGLDWQVDSDEWWRTLEINVRGPFLCTQLVLPRMMSRRRGRIVNISSGAAYRSDRNIFPYGTAYCASKAALDRMTDLLAAVVQDHGIHVFALGPGGPTAMIETLATSPNMPEQTRALFREGLADTAGIVASVQMLLFLVSGQADFLTGRHIDCWQSIDDLRLRAEEILRQDLYSVRLR